jgi:hypothetical protein
MTAGADGKRYSLEFYEEDGRKPVLEWIKTGLDASTRQEIGAAMNEILQEHGAGVCDGEFGKWVHSDLFYFRLRAQSGGPEEREQGRRRRPLATC